MRFFHVCIFSFLQLSIFCPLFISFAFELHSPEDGFERESDRKPPAVHSGPLSRDPWLTDQSEYVGLGDDRGLTIAVADFTNDRYSDLLVIPNSQIMRAVQALIWNHHVYSFQDVSECKNSMYQPIFSLDEVGKLSYEATIASSSTLDANSDGYLDVLLSVRISDKHYIGIMLLGDGSGCFRLNQMLPDVTPGLLIMDVNDDESSDIFFVSVAKERVFYLNDNVGGFMKKAWKPRSGVDPCPPTSPLNSNAFVDINGDCLPDLVVTTRCGMEVWFNDGLKNKPVSRWTVGKEFRKVLHKDFSELVLPADKGRFMLLDKSIWSVASGDGNACFADFNGDGTIDIGVPNMEDGEVRISYNTRLSRQRTQLCSVDSTWHFVTDVALRNVPVSDTAFGLTRVQSAIRVGDFNFDSKLDILLINGETGTLNLYEARSVHPHTTWFPGSRGLARFTKGLLFSITGSYRDRSVDLPDVIEYTRSSETAALNSIEDPLGAVFIDLDESGRQDILIPQVHGTRLLWNNLKEFEDSVFFKATGVDTVRGHEKSSFVAQQSFLPTPGNTFKLTYGGRYGRETHVCGQCPQTGGFSLQSCSCIFGITRIANYIEEMAMGGAHGVRTWKNLMPNAQAVVWQRRSQRGVTKWKISYLSKGRDGQMKRIVFVLVTTLVILLVVIVYTHGLERLEENGNKLAIGYT